MNKDPFEENLRQPEPSKRDVGKRLQAVDGKYYA